MLASTRPAAARLILATLLAAASPAFAADAPTVAILPVPLQPVVDPAHRLCLATTASGLGFSVLRAATGAKPGEADLTLVSYIGYLAADGQVFDQNAQAVMPVNEVIAGFGEGLRMMPRGSVYRFCIPAALGYGAGAAGPIPANAALVFQVELFDSRTRAEVEAMRNDQEAATAPPPTQ